MPPKKKTTKTTDSIKEIAKTNKKISATKKTAAKKVSKTPVIKKVATAKKVKTTKTSSKTTPTNLKVKSPNKDIKKSPIKKDDKKNNHSFAFMVGFFLILIILGVSIGLNVQYFLKSQEEIPVPVIETNNIQSNENAYDKIDKLLKSTNQDKVEINGNIWVKDSTGTIQQTSLKIDDYFWVEIPGPLVPVSIIVDSSCEICTDISKEQENIELGIPYAKTNIIDIAKDPVPSGLTGVPMILFDKKIIESVLFEEIKPYFNEIESGFELEPSVLQLAAFKKILDPNKLPKIDNPENKLAIVTYSEFACPYCKKFAEETLPLIKEKYSDQIIIEFKNYVVHESARLASQAAYCAKQIGGDAKFWQMHDLLFQNQSTLDKDSLISYASSLAIPTNAFLECLDNSETASIIVSETEEGGNLGVIGTPGIFVGNIFVNGALPFEEFDKIISSQLNNE